MNSFRISNQFDVLNGSRPTSTHTHTVLTSEIRSLSAPADLFLAAVFLKKKCK